MASRKKGKKKDTKPTSRGPEQRAGRRFLTWPVAIVAALCVIHFVLAVTSVLNKSNTYDEIAHLTRGYSYWLTGDYRLGPPHPPLAHYWASLPGRALPVRFTTLDQQAWRESDVWTIGRQFFYYKNLGNAEIIDSLLFRGRAMIALWSTAIALIVFFWARKLFGMTGGIIALVLCAFSPTMLAHGRLVTTDCAVALFFLCSLATIWWMLHRLSPWSIVCSAAALACLFLAKMSAVLIIPVGVVLLIVRLIDGRPLPVSWGRKQGDIRARWKIAGAFLGVGVFWVVVVWTSLWGAYGFRYSAMAASAGPEDRFYAPMAVPEGKTVWEHQARGLEDVNLLVAKAPVESIIAFLREHRVFPEAYIYSALFGRQTARGRNSFLNGEVDILGFQSFFPYTFLYKTPLPLAAMLVLAAGVPFLLLSRKERGEEAPAAEPRSRRTALQSLYHALHDSAPLWVFLAIYWGASLSTRLNIGHRHIMPTYPVLFILCGATAYYWRGGSKLLRGLAAVPVGLFVLASLSIYPDYLAYFNWIAGGPDRGYRHLVDSSLDWGQDLPGLKRYLDERRAEGLGGSGGSEGDVYLSYFGSGGSLAVSHYGIDAVEIPARLGDGEVRARVFGPGLYAISATRLQQVYLHPGAHEWNANLEDQYQRLRPTYEQILAQLDREGADEQALKGRYGDLYYQFQKLMMGRLCDRLRRREPDHLVNHTILIYELDQAELDEALEAPVDDLVTSAERETSPP